MIRTVFLNEQEINVTNFREELTRDQLKKVIIEFRVNGGEDYHKITEFLYKNNFLLSVPETNIELKVKISNYSTSLSDFSDANSISLFHLELTEVLD